MFPTLIVDRVAFLVGGKGLIVVLIWCSKQCRAERTTYRRVHEALQANELSINTILRTTACSPFLSINVVTLLALKYILYSTYSK